MRRHLAAALISATVLASTPQARAAGGAHTDGASTIDQSLTPEERMSRRWPQNVRVGDLMGLPVQDLNDRVLGYVTDIVRTADGKIVLVMPEGGWFGQGGRSVPIPIETVAILARHINLLDIPRDEIASLPTWQAAAGAPVDRNDIIKIAIGRR